MIKGEFRKCANNTGSQLRRLERMPDKHEVGGSTPLEPTTVNKVHGFTFASECEKKECSLKTK